MNKCALIHVENTENIIEFSEYLTDSGWKIYSANKTEELLRKKKIPVLHESTLDETAYITDASLLVKEIISSRAENNGAYSNLNEYHEKNFLIVCINLQPILNTNIASNNFREIAKPKDYFISTLLRNSIMNFENLLILTDPADYKEAMIQLKTDSITDEFRTYLAAKALNMISASDAGIATSLLQNKEINSKFLNFLMYPFKKDMTLKNGLNQQQQAVLYKTPNETGVLTGFEKLHGRDLNYQIISDVSIAWELISNLYQNLKSQFTVKSINNDGYEFTTQFTPLTEAVFTIAVKFNSIIGAALATNVLDSFKLTYNYDSANITDAILGCSSVIDEHAASEIVNCSFCAIVAPGFTDAAKEILSANKNIRLIPSSKISTSLYGGQLINGGLILQTRDNTLFEQWNVKTKNRPSQNITDEMAFGTLLSLGAKSYSAILLKRNNIVGIAQSCTAVAKSIEYAFNEASKLPRENNEPIAELLVCDAPIVFNDYIKKLIENGLSAIIQPGGTVTDKDFITYCDENDVVMVFTGMTHISF